MEHAIHHLSLNPPRQHPAPPRTSSASEDKEWETSDDDKSSSSESSDQTKPTPRVCFNCSKSQAELPDPLKRCAKCQSEHYCSRECQKADWKVHKMVCGKENMTNFDAMPDPMGGFFKGLWFSFFEPYVFL